MGSSEGEALREALDAVKAKAPSAQQAARIVDLRFWLDVDAGGSDAVFIDAVLEDQKEGGTYSWKQLEPINNLVWDELASRGIERVPHVSFHQEHEPTDEDEPKDADAP